MDAKQYKQRLDKPATVRDLEDNAAQIIAAVAKTLEEYPTKDELRQELNAALTPLATKQELAKALAPLATKQELKELERKLNKQLKKAVAPLAKKEDLMAMEHRIMNAFHAFAANTVTKAEFERCKESLNIKRHSD